MRIGFIGCGNMGSAILKGILNAKEADEQQIYIYDRFAPAAEKLTAQYAVNLCADEKAVAQHSDILFLAVKPNVLADVLAAINESLKSCDPLLVSIAAGKTTDYIASCLQRPCRIVRVMPNINALAGEAISAVCAGKAASSADLDAVAALMETNGKVLKLDETMFAQFGVLGGCSPAFVYMFIDALARAGVKHGMKKSDALKIAAQSVYGSAKMILEANEHPWELVDKVCSPGGTTIEGVLSLKKDGFESAVQNAVDAAIEKDSKL